MKQEALERMNKAIDFFGEQLDQLRTGRANPNLLNKISIDYYGVATPLNQISQISVVEGRQLVVKPYDKTQLKEIEKEINKANLGIAPQNDGTVIRLIMPALTEDTRKQLAKEVGKFQEEAKVNVRNVRRSLNDQIKKEDTLPEDEQHRLLDDIQKLTDDKIKEIDEIAAHKVKELMTI